MKKRLIYWTSLALTLVMLVASVGVVFNKMECIKSGRTVFSLTPIDNCCPDFPETSLMPQCCVFSSIAYQVEHEVTTENIQRVNADFQFIAPLPVLLARIASPLIPSVFAATDLPPPDFGWHLRLLMQSFLN